MIIEVNGEEETKKLGEKIGRQLCGGEIIELVGDVGSGKTTLTKGIALGLGVSGVISSPSFTICQQYNCRDGLRLMHYDFYRLSNAGIMANEIDESIGRPDVVTIIEWGDIVENILPKSRITIHIDSLDESARRITTSFELKDYKL